jgi:SAM-dependent methyltransferase
MNELLRRLPAEARILDLGCGNGSFDATSVRAAVVGIDLDCGSSPPPHFVQGSASALPFATGVFDAIVSNHSLEHVENLDACLKEISRVLKPEAMLYVAVPDSTTFCDRLYRWLADGGGHINPFPSASGLSQKIEAATALPHRGTRTLCTSFSFLNRKLRRTRAPRRLLLLGGGTQTSLLVATYVLRLIDRIFKTRLIVYGWALYFGEAPEDSSGETWTNVCILCGSGQSSSSLIQEKRVFRKMLLPFYRCSQCGTLNLFTRDEHYSHLSRISDIP